MRKKLVAVLGAVFLAAVLASPVLAAAQERAKAGGRSGSTIIAMRD